MKLKTSFYCHEYGHCFYVKMFSVELILNVAGFVVMAPFRRPTKEGKKEYNTVLIIWSIQASCFVQSVATRCTCVGDPGDVKFQISSLASFLLSRQRAVEIIKYKTITQLDIYSSCSPFPS